MLARRSKVTVGIAGCEQMEALTVHALYAMTPTGAWRDAGTRQLLPSF
jgi:hypothetical protein